MNDALPNPLPGDPIRAEHIRMIVKAIRRRTPRTSPSVRVQEFGDNGFTLENVRNGGNTSGLSSSDLWHNFQPYELTATSCKIGDGYVAVGSSIVRPTIGGVAINAVTPPTLTLTEDVTNYIYCRVVMTPTANGTGYVLSAAIASPTSSNCTIVASTTELSSSGNTLYFPLSQILNGAVTFRTRFANIGVRALDDGTATSTPIYETW